MRKNGMDGATPKAVTKASGTYEEIMRVDEETIAEHPETRLIEEGGRQYNDGAG